MFEKNQRGQARIFVNDILVYLSPCLTGGSSGARKCWLSSQVTACAAPAFCPALRVGHQAAAADGRPREQARASARR